MAFTARTRLVNPRLGTYFGIFTAAFAGAGADGADVRAAGHQPTPWCGSSCSPAPSPSMRRSASAAAAREVARLFRLRPPGAGLLQRAGARHDGARRRRLPGADRLALHHRLRRAVPQHRLVRRSRLHGRAVRPLRAQVRRLHACRPFSAAASRAARCASSRRRCCPCPSCCCWRPRRALPPMPRPGCSASPSA